MSITRPTEAQTARRPMSYGCADDTGPCERRHASPSNPTGASKAPAKELLSETFVFRCTASEKAKLRAKAEAAGLPASTLLREALGLTEARRRKPIPDAAQRPRPTRPAHRTRRQSAPSYPPITAAAPSGQSPHQAGSPTQLADKPFD